MSDAPTMIAGASPGWMVVRLGETRVALPIESVGEVMPVPEMSPVPMAPAWVAGIVSVRGEVVPVVDAGRRALARGVAADGRLVLVNADASGERVGLLVDGIAGLIERVGAHVEEAGRAQSGDLPARFVAARVSNGPDSRVPVLDVAALLDPAVEGAA